MKIVHGIIREWLVAGALLAGAATVLPATMAAAQAPPLGSLGAADPSAPLALTPADKAAILNAVKADKTNSAAGPPMSTRVVVGAQLPAATPLKILPDAALAQAPSAKTVQYTVIADQVVLVDPTNMRVVEVINQ